MPRRGDRAGIGKLAHFYIAAAVAEKLDSLRPGAGMAGAVHHQVGAKPADKLAHPRNARVGGLVAFDVDRRFGAELAREFKPRLLRGADANHAPGAHFLRSRDRENPDWTGTLDDDGIAPFESADPHRAIKRANARRQRLATRRAGDRQDGGGG